MTTIQHALACHIVRESFGDLAKDLAKLLIRKISCTFSEIVKDLDLSEKLVAQILSILIDQDLVQYKLNARNFVEYGFDTKNTLNRLKYPRYIYVSKTLFPDTAAEFIVEEILLHGKLEMSSCLLRVQARLKHLSLDKISEMSALKDVFIKLADSRFIRRVVELVNETNQEPNGNANSHKKANKIPALTINERTMFSVPNITIPEIGLTRAKANLPATRIRQSDSENFGDNNIYWKINVSRFDQHLRDEAIIRSFENTIDKNAASIVKAILNSLNSSAEQPVSTPITLIDIQKVVRSQYPMEPNVLDKYLSVIVQEAPKCLHKVADFGGGAYNVEFKQAITNLCLANIESFIRERYCSKSLRLFKIILEKQQLEQQQIEDFAMIPSKECKNLLYNMLNDNILSVSELSKTLDHAPSRTYYLFTVNVYQLIKKFLENSYKAFFNLMVRHDMEITENKRLIEKQTKIDTIVASLKAQNADEAEIEEVQSMLTPNEMNQIKKISEISNKIELSEIQLQETIFLFEYYFKFNVPFVKPVKK